MRNFLIAILIFTAGFTTHAQEKKKNKNAKHDIEVYGNCDMCKKRIEKAAFTVPGVKNAQWHMDHQDLHLIIDENKCSVEDVKAAVAKSGHDTNDVKAKDEEYAKLHSCCQYRKE